MGLRVRALKHFLQYSYGSRNIRYILDYEAIATSYHSEVAELSVGTDVTQNGCEELAFIENTLLI